MIEPITQPRSLRPISLKARQYFWQGLMAMLPEEGGWTRKERDEFMELVRFLIDWFVVTEEEP